MNKKQNKGLTSLFMMSLLLVFAFALGHSANAQSYQSPEAAYWGAFNQQTQRVYQGAQILRGAGRAAVNRGVGQIPQYGPYIRQGYRYADRYIQQNVNLPRRYHYQGGRW